MTSASSAKSDSLSCRQSGFSCSAAGSLDLFDRGTGELFSRDVDLRGEFTLTENLDGLLGADSTLFHQIGNRDVAAFREQRLQLVQVDDRVGHLVRVLKTAQLGQTHVQRRLSALEAVGNLVAGLRALGSAACGLTALACFTTTCLLYTSDAADDIALV